MTTVALQANVGMKEGGGTGDSKLEWDISQALPRLPTRIRFSGQESKTNPNLCRGTLRLFNSGTDLVGFKFRLNAQHALGVRPTPVGWIKPNEVVDFVLNIKKPSDAKQLLIQLQVARMGYVAREMTTLPLDNVPPARDVFEDRDKYCAQIEKYTYPVFFWQCDHNQTHENANLSQQFKVGNEGDKADDKTTLDYKLNAVYKMDSDGALSPHTVYTAENCNEGEEPPPQNLSHTKEEEDKEFDEYEAKCQSGVCIVRAKISQLILAFKIMALGGLVLGSGAGIAYFVHKIVVPE